MSVVIRPVGDDDAQAITRIYDYAVRHGTASFETEPPDCAQMRRRIAHLVEAGYPFLVAQQNHTSTVLGYAYAGPYRERSAYRYSLEDSVYLAPDAQKQGIGLKLLETLVARAQAAGFRQMFATIGDSANTASIRVHEKAGFYHIGTFRNAGYKFERWLDTVFMQRPLGLGSSCPPDTL